MLLNTPNYNSEQILLTTNPLLQQVFREVSRTWDILCLEGVRTLERQRELVLSGASKTMDSRHLAQSDGFSAALDVVPHGLHSIIDWKDTALFYYFAGYVLRTAEQLGSPLRWGGDWDRDHQILDQIELKQLNDLDHFEIPKP